MRGREYTIYQSLPEALTEYSRDSIWQQVAQHWSQVKYGVSADLVQAKVWSEIWARGPQEAISPWTHRSGRFRDGSSHLISRLQNSVQGIRAHEHLKVQYRLVEVRVRSIPQSGSTRADSDLDLFFETPEGRRRVPARRVISTLPFEVLKEVKGIELFLDLKAAEQLGWGRKSKALLYLDRPAPQRPSFSSGLVATTVWRSSELSQRWLAVERSGKVKEEYHSSDFGPLREHRVLDAMAFDFQASPFSLGSGSFPKVGLKPSAVFRQSGSWIWAGEAMSPLQSGTLHGALESAKSVIQSYFPAVNASA
jgi:hypothetical protein